MTRSRRLMHGKTFGNIAYADHPEVHNRHRANMNRFAAAAKAYRKLTVSSDKATKAMSALSALLGVAVTK